jgi:hypothetical protein
MLIFTMSCTNTPNISTPVESVPTQQLTYSSSAIPQMNSFFCNLNLNEELTFAQKYSHISSQMQSEYNVANPWTLNESEDFKDQMISYFVENNNNAFVGSQFVNVSSNFLAQVKSFKEQMTNISDPNEINPLAISLQNQIVNLSFSSLEKQALTQMVTIYKDFGTCLIQKYPSEDESARAWIKCKWYQWACVAAMTAAAVALIIASAGTALAPIIAGGATVAMVAACCFCRCRCDFTESCKK